MPTSTAFLTRKFGSHAMPSPGTVSAVQRVLDYKPCTGMETDCPFPTSSRPLVRIDQEFLAGRALVVDGDVGGIERLRQRRHLGVMAGEGGLEFRGYALAQAADLGRADLLQERRQQPASDAPGQPKGAGQFGR